MIYITGDTHAEFRYRFNMENFPDEYSRATEPPVRCGESHMSGLTGATLL